MQNLYHNSLFSFRLIVTRPISRRGFGLLVIFWASLFTPLYPVENGKKEVEQGPAGNSVQGEIEREVYNGGSLFELYYNAAQRFNPEFGKLDSSVKAKEEGYKGQTIVPSNPVLTLGLDNVPLNSFPSLSSDPMTMGMVMVSQYFSLPGEFKNRRLRSGTMVKGEKIALEEMHNRIALDIGRLLAELRYQVRKKELVLEQQGALKSIEQVARRLVSVNRMNSAQLLMLQGELLRMKSDLIEVDQQIEAVCFQLAEISGEKVCHLPPGSTAAYREFSSPATFTPESHPLYRSANIKVQLAEVELAYRKKGVIPGFSIGVAYQPRQPARGMPGEDMVSVRVSLPLPLYYGAKEGHQIKSASYDLESAKLYLNGIKLQLEKNWNVEYTRFQGYYESLQLYQSEILPRYKTSYQAMINSFSAGVIGLVDLLDNYRGYLRVSQMEAEVLKKLENSWYTLSYLSATIVPGTKGQTGSDNHENK